MRLAIVLAIAGGIVAATVAAIVASSIPTQDYSLTVDALKDEQSLFTNARVVLSNTGRLPLTDITVDFGGGQKEDVGTLDVGAKRTVSPPEGVQLDSVTVTAEPDIMIVQKYRTPIKLPGMIGS
ncbi:MAG: hypothetical protein QXJ74_08005 [Nitrososphaera sp.]|uniref:hypothetical protein n=1 Tax=Nitrososphaera sp. TaxID=1971748 RepID=UPI0017C896E8|nr:hypothetical protein [Nitrososphaera sp.]NWG36952.1 hypothetical protein [Nitrososphaera sp.]